MSTPYRVTLVQLKPGATTLGAAGDKLELGPLPPEEIYRLAGNLLKLDVSANPKAEPGIIVQRGEKGWRIAVHAGRLCMHKSTSLFDEYWTVENPPGLAQLPPFIAGSAAPFASKHPARGHSTAPQGFKVLRSIAEVVGLFALGVVLIMVGFWYGLPHRKLSDLPPDVVIVTADSDRTSVFNAVAGSYATGSGKKPGESIVTITPDGRVALGTIGKDGKPAAPRIQEQARAARKGSLAVIVTSFGMIAEFPPDAVNVGTLNTHWRRLMTN
jgi:hypothetical protein